MGTLPLPPGLYSWGPGLPTSHPLPCREHLHHESRHHDCGDCEGRGAAEGQGPMGPARPELEEELETDYASHYPEPGDRATVGQLWGRYVFSVGGGRKEDPCPRLSLRNEGWTGTERATGCPLEGHGGTGGTTPQRLVWPELRFQHPVVNPACQHGGLAVLCLYPYPAASRPRPWGARGKPVRQKQTRGWIWMTRGLDPVLSAVLPRRCPRVLCQTHIPSRS